MIRSGRLELALCALGFSLLTLIDAIELANAQSTPPTDDTQIRRSMAPQGDPNISPPPWTNGQGSCDTSSEVRWGFQGGWRETVPPIPSPGHDHFLSCGSWRAGGESAIGTISGLTPGESYTLSFNVAGFRATNATYGVGTGDSYRVVIGNEDSGYVPYTYTDSWINQQFSFVADAIEETITVFGPGPDTTPFRMTHFSFPGTATSLTTLLTLQKTVINNDGGSATENDFVLIARGPEMRFGFAGDSAITNAVVDPGTYFLSELGVDGYNQTDLVCTGGADTDPSDGLEIAISEEIVCTFTNDDESLPNSLSVSKTTSVNPIVRGTPFDYIITVIDESADGADAVDVMVTDFLDPRLTCNSVTASNASSTGSASGCTTPITCSWSRIANGGSETCTINITP